VKTRAIVDRDYTPTGTVDLVRKDVDLMLEAATRANLGLPVLAAVDSQFAKLQAMGRGGEDVAAITELPREPDNH